MIDALEINGQAHAGPWAVGAQQSLVLAVPLARAAVAGDVWTVALQLAAGSKSPGASPLGWGARVLPEAFPLMTWPHGEDCPFPGVAGADPSHYHDLADVAIDTALVYTDAKTGACSDRAGIIDTLGRAKAPLRLWAEFDPVSKAQDLSNVDAVFLGDEVDGDLNAALRDPRGAAANAKWPRLFTYQGGKTNAHVGAFAGITDVQGMDAYCAACAPTMLPVTMDLPLQYPYLYIRNARDNHMPLPSMLYSQLYNAGKGGSARAAPRNLTSHADASARLSTGSGWSYQANYNELTTQIGSVLLAGAKGLTLFQTNSALFRSLKVAQSPVGAALRSIAHLRETLRVGDIAGLRFTTTAALGKQALIEVIRAPARVLVVVVSTNADGYNNLLCHVFSQTHWNFSPLLVEHIAIFDSPVPLGNFTEVVDGSDVAPQGNATAAFGADGRSVDIANVAIDGAAQTLRIFSFDVLGAQQRVSSKSLASQEPQPQSQSQSQPQDARTASSKAGWASRFAAQLEVVETSEQSTDRLTPKAPIALTPGPAPIARRADAHARPGDHAAAHRGLWRRLHRLGGERVCQTRRAAAGARARAAVGTDRAALQSRAHDDRRHRLLDEHLLVQ